MILRLNDLTFYPLAILAVVGMVAPQLILANSNWESLSQDVIDNGVTIEGSRLSAMAAGQGTAFEMVRDSRGRLVARITADRPLGDPTVVPSAGVFDALQIHELEAMAGYTLRVTFTLNASDIDGAASTHLGAFQSGVGQSAWQEFEISGDTDDYELMVYPPNCVPGFAYFGVWPSAESGANSLDLHQIRIEAVEQHACTSD